MINVIQVIYAPLMFDAAKSLYKYRFGAERWWNSSWYRQFGCPGNIWRGMSFKFVHYVLLTGWNLFYSR